MKLMIREAFFIMLTALVLSVSAWLFAPPPPIAPAGPVAAVQEIDQGTLKLILAADPHLLVDARSDESYRSGHLPGAVSLPLAEFEDRYPLVSHLFRPDLTVIVYCSASSCRDADLLAQFLQEQKIGNLLVYRGGFAEWDETGNTVETGERP